MRHALSLKVHPSLALILNPFRLSSVRLLVYLICLLSNDYTVSGIAKLCWIEVYHREFLLSNVDNTLEARIIPAFMSSDLFRNGLRNVFGTLESYILLRFEI